MPRRTIPLGRRSTTFDFQDDAGPLANGLGYAAGQWLASGRDRAMIEMETEKAEAAKQERLANREQDVDFRQQDLELRRLALGQQSDARQDQLAHQADVLRQTKVRDAANAAEAMRDDVGAVGKFAFENTIGRFLNQKPATPPSVDLNRDKFNWERAVQEVGGDGEFRMVPLKGVDDEGRPLAPQKIPLTPEEKASRMDRINARFNELNGATWKPIALPDDSAPSAVPQAAPVAPPSAPAPTGAAPSLSTSALGGNAPGPQQLTPAGAAPTSEQAQQQIPVTPQAVSEAIQRVNQTLTTVQTLTPEQRQRLARTVADAQANNPQAIQALLRWHAKQADTQTRSREDQLNQAAMTAAGDSQMRATALGY